MTPWTVACQTPLSVGFSRQEYWSGLPFPSPGDLPNPGLLHCRQILYHLSHSVQCSRSVHVQLFVTPWTAARQVSLSITNWSRLFACGLNTHPLPAGHSPVLFVTLASSSKLVSLSMFIEHLHCVLLTTNCLCQLSKSKCSSISPVAGTTPTQVGAATHPSEDLLCMFMSSQIGQTPRCCRRATHPRQDLPWPLPSLQAVRSQVSSLLYPLSFQFPCFFPRRELRYRDHKSYTNGSMEIMCGADGWRPENLRAQCVVSQEAALGGTPGARTWVLSCSGQGAMSMQR